MDAIETELQRVAARQRKLHRTSKECVAALLDSLDALEAELDAGGSAPESVARLEERKRAFQDATSSQQKELNGALTKYAKCVDKTLSFDLKRACRGAPLNVRFLECAVAEHLFREGEFALGEQFTEEAGLTVDASVTAPFAELHRILDALHGNDLAPAIEWARRHRRELAALCNPSKKRVKDCSMFAAMMTAPSSSGGGGGGGAQAGAGSAGAPMAVVGETAETGADGDGDSHGQGEGEGDGDGAASELEFKLHRLRFIDLLQRGELYNALMYARQVFPQFAKAHSRDIQQLMACFAFVPHLSQSPYAALFTSMLREDVEHTFRRDCWAVLGLAVESPLHTVVRCGAKALPTLIKAARLLPAKETWTATDELPVEVELDRDCKYHSIFVCPVSRDQSTEENPPMLLPCGHVLCKQTIARLPRGGTRFKCPYCPSEQQIAACREVTF